MSDPTIQTFCCHHTGNKEDVAVKIMNEFNTDSYNAVCLVSSIIGIFGAIYQASGSPDQSNNGLYYLEICESISFKQVISIILLFQVFPCFKNHDSLKWQTFSSTRGRRIIIWLAIADMLASFGKFYFNVSRYLLLIVKNLVLFCKFLLSTYFNYF